MHKLIASIIEILPNHETSERRSVWPDGTKGRCEEQIGNLVCLILLVS